MSASDIPTCRVARPISRTSSSIPTAARSCSSACTAAFRSRRVTAARANSLPNPLKTGAPCENNGTMIIDVTDPANPVEKFLIPSPVGGQSQMARMCLGSQISPGTRTTGRSTCNATSRAVHSAGYEVWDVTDVTAPVMTSSDPEHSVDAQALVGVQDGHRLHAGQQERQLDAPGTPLWQPVAGDADLSTGAIPTPTPDHTSARSDCRAEQPGATGATSQLAAWRDLDVRASAGGADARARRHGATTSSATASTRPGAWVTTA